ncbi:MAG: hypothetical protein K2M48_01665 [Clostridiales bacterium]|nr:hypothetical protein [Clostridiales bacterium]
MGKASDFLTKLKKIKHIGLIAGAVVIVIVLVSYFSLASCSSDSASLGTSADLGDLDYCTAMQVRLERIVSEIDGVGDASVIINWDKSVSTSLTSSGSENPRATGVIVVCKGGNSTKVKLDVIYAVSTLLDLSIEKIMVYPKS